MKYSGAEIIIKMLERQGIETIAGIPGGANLPLYDALYKSGIRHILARHEQGAGFIAQGMARSTGNPAVCFATSGPGAANLLTAIADAKLDSIPVIAITGQVSVDLIGKDSFQEVDTFGMSLPVTKHNFLVKDAALLPEIIATAFRIAGGDRPGPVLIDVPKNVQKQIVEIDQWPEVVENSRQIPPVEKSAVKKAARMINGAMRPLLYIGGGLIHSDASEEIFQLAEKNSLPVTSSLMGLGSFPSDHPLFINMLGMHGAGYTNRIMREIDLLISVGVRFDDRATGKVSEFSPQANILHIDLDPSEINKIREADFSIVADAKEFLNSVIPLADNNKREKWISRVNDLRKEFPLIIPKENDFSHPLNIIKRIASTVPEDTIITTDVGQHQMWTAQVFPFRHPRTLLTSGGAGTMGFGLPSAIGAALALPDKKIVCISGDGSFLMNIQEMAVMADTGVNVTVIILNNRHLGLVRQQQQLFYGERYIASGFESTPDFAAAAKAFGIKGFRPEEGEDPTGAIEEALRYNGPAVVDVPIDHKENVYPMVPPGAANHEMIENPSDQG